MTIAENDILDEQPGESSLSDMVTEEVDIEEAIEAILFAAGHPLTYAQLAKPFEMAPSLMKERVYAYAQSYNNSEVRRGVILLTFEESCQLCTKQEYLQHIRVALGIRRSGSLSTSCIETLAIIAYNQPTTRSYVDAIRCVDSTYAMTTLLERGLIEPKGRLEAPGRPVLYGTSDGFLRSFGLRSLEDLPGISSEEAYEVLAKMSNEQNPNYDADQMTIDVPVSTDNTSASSEDESLSERPADSIPAEDSNSASAEE